MGGWLGTNDACAITSFDGATFTNHFVQDGRLFYPLHDEIRECLKTIISHSEHRAVIAIDAALAWPVEFAALVAGATQMTHLPAVSFNSAAIRQIAVPYLFRETERYLRQVCLKKDPLTPVGDKFGNNSTKAQVLASQMRRLCEESSKELSVYRPPFDGWDRKVAAQAKISLIEVYPTASRTSKMFCNMRWPGTKKTTLGKLDKTDVGDAKICAMTAACYGIEVGIVDKKSLLDCKEVGTSIPPVYTPDDLPEDRRKTISQEGWIFAPKDEQEGT
jgi:hypothetical protein